MENIDLKYTWFTPDIKDYPSEVRNNEPYVFPYSSGTNTPPRNKYTNNYDTTSQEFIPNIQGSENEGARRELNVQSSPLNKGVCAKQNVHFAPRPAPTM